MPCMGGKNFTEDERKRMLSLAAHGLRAPAIAAELGRHRASVCRFLKQAGLSQRSGPTPIDPKERFLAFLEADRRPGTCWEWQGGTDGFGYGQFALNGIRAIGAHVASYRLYKGEIPKGILVRHDCDNPSCVNPAHLRLGTHQDNMDDCVSRRRTAKGEQQGLSVMTEARVSKLRKQHAGGVTQMALSRRFCISQPTVSQIVRRKTWRHVA